MKKFKVNFYRSGKIYERKDFTAYNVNDLQKKIVAHLTTLYAMFFSADFSYKIRVA